MALSLSTTQTQTITSIKTRPPQRTLRSVPRQRFDFYRGALLDSKYVLNGLIAEGGWGDVIEATVRETGRPVAVKVAGQDAKEYLAKEGNAISSLPPSPHLVGFIDQGDLGDYGYLVMERIKGRTLDAEIARNGGIPPLRALDYISQINHGLAVAARNGIYHKDIKPENIMIREDGTAVLIDFGLAMHVPKEGHTTGTPVYMSPEQMMGEEIDHRSDLYSLGIVMWETQTAEKAFYSARIYDYWGVYSQKVVVGLPKIPDALPPLQWLVDKMTAAKKEKRHQTHKELERDIKVVKKEIKALERKAADFDQGVREMIPEDEMPTIEIPLPSHTC